jgi:hypothetical protein
VLAAIKEDIPCAFCSCPHSYLPPVSRCRRTASVFRRSVGVCCLTPPLSPCAGPGAPQGPRVSPRPTQITSSPPLSSCAVDRADELCPLRRPLSSLRVGALNHVRHVRHAPCVLMMKTLPWGVRVLPSPHALCALERRAGAARADLAGSWAARAGRRSAPGRPRVAA